MSNKPVELFTIGAYGFTAEAFFGALERARIDTFCDIRRRRGVRGSEYAFANSARLQERLSELGINYIHRLDLAPTEEVRSIQEEADHASRTARRKRNELSPNFAAAYRDKCLRSFDSRDFVGSLGADAKRVVLFCVEREPAACHRSLVAERLCNDLGIKVEHLTP